MADARLLWLCGQPREGRADPLALTVLQNKLIEHIKWNGKSLTRLNGLGYLISDNHSDKVLRFLFSVRDIAVVSGSKLIVPLDPPVLSPRDLALIERELIVRH